MGLKNYSVCYRRITPKNAKSQYFVFSEHGKKHMGGVLEFWANYTEFLPSSQAIPALPTASNACSKEKKTFYSVSWIKRQ